jgi:hypothetical protein
MVVLLVFFGFVFPFGCFLFLNAILDVDHAQVMAAEAFERENPNLDAKGGHMIYYDPLAYTIEVHGYEKGRLIFAKKEVYRVYWWGKVTKFDNILIKLTKGIQGLEIRHVR